MSSARVLRRTARAREQGGAFQIALAPLSEADATQLVQRFVEGWIRLDNGIIQESRRTSLQRYIRALNNDARAAPNSPGPGDGLGRRGRNGRGGRNRRGGRTRRGGRNGRGRGGAESTDDNDGSEDDGNGLEDDGDEPADNDPDVLNDGNGQDIPGGVGDAAGTENEGQDGQLSNASPSQQTFRVVIPVLASYPGEGGPLPPSSENSRNNHPLDPPPPSQSPPPPSQSPPPASQSSPPASQSPPPASQSPPPASQSPPPPSQSPPPPNQSPPPPSQSPPLASQSPSSPSPSPPPASQSPPPASQSPPPASQSPQPPSQSPPPTSQSIAADNPSTTDRLTAGIPQGITAPLTPYSSPHFELPVDPTQGPGSPSAGTRPTLDPINPVTPDGQVRRTNQGAGRPLPTPESLEKSRRPLRDLDTQPYRQNGGSPQPSNVETDHLTSNWHNTRPQQPRPNPAVMEGERIIASYFSSRPGELLKLTSRTTDKDYLENTMRQTLQIPDVRSLRYDSRRIIVDFVGSLFHPATYWSIRECAHSVTANTGLRTEDRSATDRQNKVKVEGKRPNGVLERCTISQGTARGVLSSGTERRTGDHTGRQRETYQTSEPSGQTDNGEYTMPSCVSDYVKAWTQYQRWSSQTARPQLTTMMTMSLEGELYVYWCRVARVWVEVFEEIYGYRVAEGDGVPDDTAGTRSANAGLLNDAEVKIAHEEKESLRKFFYKELGKRGYVTGLGPRFPIGRPMHLLRQMIAPYIGFPSLLGPQVEVSRQEDRDCIYEKLWYRQIRGGKVNYMVMRSLGWGALAVMKRGHIKTIGPRILPLILPIIRERHPELPEIFEILFCAFVQPVRSGHPLIFHEVGHFMSIPSRNALIAACKNQADGLRGIFELGRRPIQSLSEATIVESTMNDDDAFNVADLLQRELANDKAEAEEHVRLRGMKRPASVTPNGDTERRMGRRTRYRMSPTRQSSV